MNATIKFETRDVTSIKGEEPAHFAVCGHCGGDRFYIYCPASVGHQHLQCVQCGLSFCSNQGVCQAYARN